MQAVGSPSILSPDRHHGGPWCPQTCDGSSTSAGLASAAASPSQAVIIACSRSQSHVMPVPDESTPLAAWIAMSLIFWTLFLIIFSTSTRCHMRMAWQEAQHGVSQANFRWSTDPSWIRDALPPKSTLFHSSVTMNTWMSPFSGIPAAFCPVPCPHPRHRPLRTLVQHPSRAACRTTLPHQPHHSRAPECAPRL